MAGLGFVMTGARLQGQIGRYSAQKHGWQHPFAQEEAKTLAESDQQIHGCKSFGVDGGDPSIHLYC